ncbi:hypothetical protein C8J56DRAFT_1117496 [Mycena floridula]|nr:hypothetical protein C8J56DRAFT_1117496 [Mycena floridula]
MNLHLSGHSILNSEYADDAGRVIYRVQTPHKLGARTSTITCRIDNSGNSSGQECLERTGLGLDKQDISSGEQSLSGASQEQTLPTEIIQPGRFGHLAQIDWKIIKFSIIRYGGVEYDTKRFFRKVGFGWYGRHRAFTAPDNKDYRWILGTWVPTLVTDDKAQTPIATFHRRRWLFGKRKAYLEIFPEGMHFVNVILVTFVYIEKLRRDKERAAKRHGAGGT